jgi:hypothetical protein
MNFSPAPRTDTSASIVGGLLGGLAVAGSVIAFFTLRDPRVASDTEAVTELRIAAAELKVQVAELKEKVARQEAERPAHHPFPPMPPAPPAPLVDVSAPPAPPPPMPPGLEHAISCPAENHCTIDRNYIDEALANPMALARQARVIPSIREGRMHGFKLYGIRPGSLPKLLGYKNGDTILSLNGVPLDSAEAALASYNKLRGADTLSVEVERRGETLIMRCDLR